MTEKENKSSFPKTPLAIHLIAGGGAGFVEALACHPLDTIKVRMQLQAKQSTLVNHYDFIAGRQKEWNFFNWF